MSAVRRYVARPVEIEAIEWLGNYNDLPLSWRATDTFTLDPETDELRVQTLDGPSTARLGDFVARGTAGEYYPIRRPIFAFKYEEVRQ